MGKIWFSNNNRATALLTVPAASWLCQEEKVRMEILVTNI